MRREKRREKRKRGDNFHLGMKRNFSLAGVIHVQFDQFSAKLRRISTKYNVFNNPAANAWESIPPGVNTFKSGGKSLKITGLPSLGYCLLSRAYSLGVWE